MSNLFFTAIWAALGIIPWIYCHTKKFDLSAGGACGFFFLGLVMGPLSIFIAPAIYGAFDSQPGKPLIKKR